LKLLPFVLKHLRQAWVRTASTVLAMALAIFLFCILETVLARVKSATAGGNPNRLVTTNVMEMMALSPSYAERIEKLPGVKRVARMVMFGGFLRVRREGRPEPGSESDWTRFSRTSRWTRSPTSP
jgi:hypothetical protein